MRVPASLPCRGPLLGLGYLIAWLCLQSVSEPSWDLVAGLRFATLLLTPMRYWPWLVVADWSGSALTDWWLGPASLGAWAWGAAPGMLVVVLAVALARRAGTHPLLSTPEHVVRVLAATLFAAVLITVADTLILASLHRHVLAMNFAGALGSELLGDYLGILLLTPIAIALVRARPSVAMLRRLSRDVVMVFVPALVVLYMLVRQGAPLSQFARTLALAPVLYFAFRHGWRGAAGGILVVSAAMTLFTSVAEQLATPAQARLFMAVAGSATLMLGSAIDALRRSSHRLAIQNARLEGANQRLDHLANRLSDAARRNLRAEEEQRRYMAAELHDELGQNLTAIQTRVKLAQGRLQAAGLDDVTRSINDILGHMRAAVRRMLDTLRPTVLDEFGLARALEDGPIRDLLRAAGIRYQFELHGDPHRLDEDTRLAVYRVAQEAATNTVRHAQAANMRVRLRIGRRGCDQLILLDIRDDGIGLPRHDQRRRGGRGLQSMRDRVTALGGVFRVRASGGGTHLHMLLRTPRPVISTKTP